METKNKIPFFDIEDINLLKEVGGKRCEKGNKEHQAKGEKIKNGACEKTKYWQELVVEKLDNLGYEKNNFRRKWQNSGYFSLYTWAQIYKKGDEDKGIYFTVGTNADHSNDDLCGLVYKLDYQQVDNTRIKLTSEQKQLCHDLIKESTASRITIPSHKLKEYTWDKLVDETVEFIIKYTPLYDESIAEVGSLNSKWIARIAYNTEGWVKPSGKYGKSKSEDSFELKNDYGHEEWLFDIAKTYKGYHYAFLSPIQKGHQAYEGKCYDVVLFTINGETKRRYYIGEIFNLEVISEAESQQVYQYYKKQGWLNEMIEQVKSISEYKDFAHWKSLDVFNVRFKVSDIKQNDSLGIPIPSDNPIYNLNHYSFARYKDEFGLIGNSSNIDTYNFDTAKSSQDEDNNSKVKKGIYERPPKTVEIEYLHQAISYGLLNKLKKEGRNVKMEVGAGYGGNRIDMVEQVPDGDIFYEIKTYPSLKTSIRMAIGQLLEYSLWTEQEKAKELIIVTQVMPDSTDAKKYLPHIRKTYNIPIYYQSFNIETNELSEKM